PYRVVVGGKGLKEGLLEVKARKTGEVEKVPPAQALERLLEIHRGQ
ncbi:proline--tRNA ligase, partial [bacterium]